jgi:leucine dehydrogenase
VINAGGIINICTEYLDDGDASVVRSRIEGIPERLEQVWTESATTGLDPASVADAMAQRLIGRG